MDRRMFSGLAALNFSLNLSDDRELLDPPAEGGRLSPTGFIVLSVALGFIMVFGFLNNFIVLLLFCKFKKLRTPVNMLLLNISVSDMLVCLCGTTLSFASSIRGRWLLGRSGCSWYGFINSCFGEWYHRWNIHSWARGKGQLTLKRVVIIHVKSSKESKVHIYI